MTEYRIKCDYRGDHKGQLLARNDPRAWRGTMAFPSGGPDPTCASITQHLRQVDRTMRELGHTHGTRKVPVLWDFGLVCWDCVSSLDVVRA